MDSNFPMSKTPKSNTPNMISKKPMEVRVHIVDRKSEAGAVKSKVTKSKVAKSKVAKSEAPKKVTKSKIDLDKDSWKILDSYFIGLGTECLVKHQLDSFNDFMHHKIPDIISQVNPVIVYHQFSEKHNKHKYEIQIRFINIDESYEKPKIHEYDGCKNVMTPHLARLRNFTYATPLHIDIEITHIERDGENFEKVSYNKKTLRKITIGSIPIMLKSDFCILKDSSNGVISPEELEECKYDPGGYFIVNGNEKAVVSQEKIADNKLYCFRVNKTNNKTICIAEIKSMSDKMFTIPKNFSVRLIKKGGGLVVKAILPNIRQEIPLFVLFRALGVESDMEILKYIVYDLSSKNYKLMYTLEDSINEATFCQTQNDAFDYLMSYVVGYGQPKDIKLDNENKKGRIKSNILDNLLPHVGNDISAKIFYLGYMVNNLLRCHLGFRDFDDRDSYTNKRIELPGILLANLFRQYFSKMHKDMKNAVIKELNTCHNKLGIKNIINETNIHKLCKSSTIETGLKYGLATGNWGIKSSSNKVGIAQVLSRLNYSSTLSHLRRLATPTEKTGKLIAPRKLHNTQWGTVCPAETPEGGSVGVVKNLAITTIVTNMTNPILIVARIESSGLIKLDKIGDSLDMEIQYNEIPKYGKVFVNGKWLGLHSNLSGLCEKLRTLKRMAVINPYTSISWNMYSNELSVYTDGGRCTRPLLMVDNNRNSKGVNVNTLRISKNDIQALGEGSIGWNNLINQNLHSKTFGSLEQKSTSLKEGLIEYIDVEEAHNCLIAMKQVDLKQKHSYTHCEIHPCTILGILASTIPYPDHNQSPRNTYQSAMGKQAMGVYSSNYQKRMDTLGHVLSYPNMPLVQTHISKYLNMNRVPTGRNTIVAIASYSGYNQEDSIIMNKSFIDRGGYHSTFYRSYRDDEKKQQSSGKEEKFTNPDPNITKNIKPCNYTKLDETGFVPKNTYVSGDDIIIGKVFPIKNDHDKSKVYRDSSTALRANEDGYIDEIYINHNNEGNRFCKIRVRSERIPTVGDKFSSRHGQKGTVGMVYQQQDMPYTKNGVVPDLIMNPHAVPSRMTIAQLLECLLGKACVHLGGFGNGTPFVDCNFENIQKTLMQSGFERYGNEVLYNGRTGKQMTVSIFMGPTYYQRLKHLVADKIHSRSHGPIVQLTRQPSEGRARDGGLRFGEMERDCMIAHGSSQFLKERMLDASDNYRLFICQRCGLRGIVNPEKDIYICKNCHNQTAFSEVRIPYGFKLCTQELEAMSISTKIIT